MRTKRISRFFCIIVTVCVVSPTAAFPKAWNGITPCVSTRADVERILGKEGYPVPDSLGSYRHLKARVYVYYLRGDETTARDDIVEKIHVYPEKSRPLHAYIARTPKFYDDFVKTEIHDRVSHVNGLAYYRSQKEGFEIWVQKNYENVEVITRLAYFDDSSSCAERRGAALHSAHHLN